MWPSLVKLYFVLRFRRLVNDIQRWWKGEHKEPRAQLPTEFGRPEDVESFIRVRFLWRPDGTRLLGRFIALDYITHPEVFQARITDGDREEGEGDCDDFHFWVAHVLKSVPGVSQTQLLSCVWKGGGHTTCVYEYKGHWYLFNYRISGPIALEEAPVRVLEWANRAREKDDEPLLTKLKFWCRETTDHKLVAVGSLKTV